MRSNEGGANSRLLFFSIWVWIRFFFPFHFAMPQSSHHLEVGNSICSNGQHIACPIGGHVAHFGRPHPVGAFELAAMPRVTGRRIVYYWFCVSVSVLVSVLCFGLGFDIYYYY
jgi:hypothetical protein